MEDLKKLALAQHLYIGVKCVGDGTEFSNWGDCAFKAEGEEYLVLTDDEAHDMSEEGFDKYLEEHLKIPDSLKRYFDEDAWKTDARLRGRGEALALYDELEYEEIVEYKTVVNGVELTEDVEFYIFRVD